MADGGEDFGDEKTPILQNTDDQDDDEQMADRTQPFQPSASSTPQNGREQAEMKTTQVEHSGLPSFEETTPSTPYNRGEQMEMKTTQQEHPGLPSFDETTFSGRNITVEEIEKRLAALRNPRTGILDVDKVDENGILLTKEQKRSQIVEAKKYTKSKYPNAKIDELKLDFSQKRPNQIVVIGPRGGETKVFLDDGSGFTQKFLNLAFVKKILGDPAEIVIKKQSYDIRKKQKQVEKDRKKEVEAKQSLSEQDDLIMNLNSRLNKENALIDQMKDQPEYKEEIKRKKQLTKNLEKDLKDATKERKEREKLLKNASEQNRKNDLLEKSISEEKKNRDSMEERLNQTKQFEDLKDQERQMLRKKAEYEEVMQDEKASPSAKQAAQEGWDEINEELARFQPQIEERARARPLLERVKEIFKKYGVTVTSVLLAAGITIGVVVSTVTNALKASTKALGKGLKDIGAKLGSMLPGLIGSVASFLFKVAGQAIGFLAEHTWLLILAVVAFLFEKNIKKRR